MAEPKALVAGLEVEPQGEFEPSVAEEPPNIISPCFVEMQRSHSLVSLQLEVKDDPAVNYHPAVNRPNGRFHPLWMPLGTPREISESCVLLGEGHSSTLIQMI